MAELGRPPLVDAWGDAGVRFIQLADNEDDCWRANAQEKAGAAVENGSGGRAHKAHVLQVSAADGTVLTVAPGVGLRKFAFDQVFDIDASQDAVYNKAARTTVVDAVNGVNSSIIVYGQTGSGKTHTMFGAEGAAPGTQVDGMVLRACEEVLAAASVRSEQLGVQTEVTFSYVEIYGMEVNDLLQERTVVGKSRVAGQRYVLDGNTAVSVASVEEVRALLQQGAHQKRQATTLMNDHSSRAHSLVVVGINQEHPATRVKVASKLFLVDLGGSEKLTQSKADAEAKAAGMVGWDEYYRQRTRLQETININMGLFTLKKCIDALNDREVAVREGRSPPYIPYQDSKLTMLLSPALGGESKTLIIVTATAEDRHAVETVQTLRFGERCANVVNRLGVNTRDLRELLERLDAEISATEGAIRSNERWESRRIVRADTVEGEVVQEEFITTSVLVGAEEERAALEVLLRRRRELLGVEEKPEEAAAFAFGTGAAGGTPPDAARDTLSRLSLVAAATSRSHS